MALRVSIGQYYSADSPIHRLDPRVKLVGAVAFMVSCLFVHTPATLALAGVAVLAAVALARVPLGRLVAQIRPIALFLVLTSLINLLFVSSGAPVLSLGPLTIYSGGLEAAALYTLRFLLLLLAGSLLTLTTTPVALADAAERLLKPLEACGVPVGQGVLVFTIALRFVPILAQEARSIVAAQTARGAEIEHAGALAYARACVPLVVPLFAGALRHAEHLGRAMDARGYTGQERTHYHVLRLDARRDAPAIAMLACYLALLITFNLVGW